LAAREVRDYRAHASTSSSHLSPLLSSPLLYPLLSWVLRVDPSIDVRTRCALNTGWVCLDSPRYQSSGAPLAVKGLGSHLTTIKALVLVNEGDGWSLGCARAYLSRHDPSNGCIAVKYQV